ncbi:MAG: GGDEF domain-containing phosphodiesterase, partial [Acidobacteria bacterium]|nr:GGDEF domain-containing phosphodiesterase [Acidobacteriota bacterium]
IESEIVHLVEQEILNALLHPVSIGDVNFSFPARFGIALCPDDGVEADALILKAEMALKRAKAAGESFSFFEPAMQSRVAGRLTFENRLRQALKEQQFVLHYQPKVSAIDNEITGMDALIRWHSPKLGLVPPGQFIPLLEETGMILDVGRWVMAKALDDRRNLQAKGIPAPRIAVNVSTLQVRRKSFVEDIAHLFGQDASLGGFELEVTESLLMDDFEATIDKLKRVRKLGLKIAIDDFGTGYSSLGYLLNLPVDSVKIDRVFILDIASSARHSAIIESVIALAHSLDLLVVAEGVETKEQADLLRKLNCDEMQGYYFSKPLPFEQIEETLRAKTS